MSQKKVAVVLSGCGVFDGTEIQEAVLTLLAIVQQGAAYQCFAPDVAQMHVINHLTGEESAAESRNVLIESARIARGDVLPLEKYNAADYDAIVFPGGFGAAKNLSTFAVDGTDCTVHEQVKAAIVATVEAQKPVGALCIAPVLLAQVLGDGVVTIGQDEGVAAAIEAFGATHLDADHEEVVLDPNLKLVTTPCYMLDAHIGQIAKGASAVVKEVLHLCA